MTLYKAQVIIQNMRYKLSITNAGLDMLNEKQALDTADTILENEILKESGCDYCNTTRIQSMIGYQYMSYCPRCGKKITR
jgi:hypothetical protein